MPASSQTQLRSCVLRCGRSGFAVDYWGRNPCVGAVFLTHAHADHLCGLSDAWEPDGRTVYCSAVTKALLFRKFPRLASDGTCASRRSRPTRRSRSGFPIEPHRRGRGAKT